MRQQSDALQVPQWPDRIHAVFGRAGIRQVGYVPDAGRAWLGGQRSALLMQSSGIGNCVNMLAMTRTCRFPLLMLVTMRGKFEESNPQQVPMGTAAEAVLRLGGLDVRRVDAAADVKPVVEWLLNERLATRPPWRCSGRSG